MIDFIKKNIFITSIFIITLSVGFLTLLTFIDKSFIELNEFNLQFLLILNVVFFHLQLKPSKPIDFHGFSIAKPWKTDIPSEGFCGL